MEPDRIKKLRQRKLYIFGRLASLKQELKSVTEEKKSLNAKLKDPKALDAKALKSLRQRKVYVKIRPESLKAELKTLTDERNSINTQLKKVK